VSTADVPGNPEGVATPWSNHEAALLIALLALAILPLFVALYGVPVVPSHDGPANLYSAHVFAHANDPAFRDDFERSHPVTALGFGLIYGALETVLPWQSAYATALALGLLAMPLGIGLIAHRIDARRTPITLVALGAAHGWTSHMGFINYVGSLGLGFLALGLGLTAKPWSTRRELGVYATLLAASIYHPFGSQFSSIALFVHVALHTQRSEYVRRLGGFCVGAMPALLVTLVARENVEAAARGAASSRLDLTALERVEGLGRWFLSGPSWRWGGAFVLAVVALGFVARDLVGQDRSHKLRRALPLVTVVLLGFAGVALLPMHAAEWQYFQPRFNPLVVLPWLPLLPLERLHGKTHRGASIGLAAWAFASNAWVAHYHLGIVREYREAYAGLEQRAPAPGRSLIPIIARPELAREHQVDRSPPVPHATHLNNLGLLYAIARGAVAPYGFTSMPNVHLVTRRPSRQRKAPIPSYGGVFAPGTSSDDRRHLLARLATYAAAYDDVLFYGTEADADAFLAHGFVTEHRSGGFFLASFRGCPATLEITGDAREGTIHLAFPGSLRIVASQPLPSRLPATIALPRASCLGVRVLVEATDVAGQPVSCREAAERPNELRTVADTNGGRVASCHLAR
jgi:hypothetical protein